MLRLFLTWVQACSATLVCVASVWLVAQFTFHLKLLNVQTNSMRPAFQHGDALILRRATSESLHPGMVVSYRSSRNPNELVTHRVVQIDGDAFRTKGDALQVSDPTVRNSLLVGRVIGVVPGFGKVLGWLISWPGLTLCVYMPLASLLVTEVRRLSLHYMHTAKYSLYKAQVV